MENDNKGPIPPTFKTVPGTRVTYAATPDGQVYRVRTDPPNPPTFKRLTESVGTGGLVFVNLCPLGSPSKGYCKRTAKARAVAAAYGLLKDPWEPRAYVKYRDGNRLNCSIDNLIVTHDRWLEARQARKKWEKL